ncbi:hypothetical protein NFI96_032359, partial [Prochilodus magdalenae]
MYYSSEDSLSSSDEEEYMEKNVLPSWRRQSPTLQTPRTQQSFLPSIVGHRSVQKCPKKISAFDRAVQITDRKALKAREAARARFEKNREENTTFTTRSFKHHLTPLDAEPVLTYSGVRGIQHDEYLPHLPVKCLEGVDRAHPLKPIQGRQNTTSRRSPFLEPCSTYMPPEIPVGSVIRKTGKHCLEPLWPREDQACSPVDSDDLSVSIQEEILHWEEHLRQEAQKVVDALQGVQRNMSSAISADVRTDSGRESLSPVDLYTPEELRVLPTLRTPEPPPKPKTPRSNVSRMRSRRILSQTNSTTPKATDEPPSVHQKKKMEKTTDSTLCREHPLTDPELRLMQAFHLLKAEDWEKKVEGLACIRALAEHHGDVMMPKLHDIILLVTQEVKNLRSVVARAAMGTLGHMFEHLQKTMDKELERTACVLLQKSGESNNFIREDAELALGHMVDNCTPGRVLNALVSTGLNHRNVAVRRCTAVNLQKLAELIGAPRIMTSKTDLPRGFLVSISKLAVDSAQDVRSHARNVLGLLSTHKNFNKMVDKFVPDKDAATVREIITKLRRLKRFGMDPRILRTFYTCTVESILTGSITTWYGSCTAIERKALQRVVRTAQYITGVQLPNLLDLYTSRCLRKTRKILKDSTHPSHCLFSQLPSGR